MEKVFLLKRSPRNEPCKTRSPNVGLEPTTLRLRVSCSTDWASRAVLTMGTLCKDLTIEISTLWVPLWKWAFPAKKDWKELSGPSLWTFWFWKVWTNFDLFWAHLNQFDSILSQFWQASSTLDKFDPIWTGLIHFSQVESIIDIFGPIWTSLNQFGQVWQYLTSLNQLWQIWITLDKFNPLWASLNQSG